MSNEDFGTWLKEALKDKGWSQRHLAERIGMGQSAISKTISGKTKPTAELVIRIANAMGESPERLLRMAEILPQVYEDETSVEITEIVQGLSKPKRKQVLDFVRFLRDSK